MTDESNGDVVQVQCLDQHMQIMSHIATIKMKKKDYIMEHFFLFTWRRNPSRVPSFPMAMAIWPI